MKVKIFDPFLHAPIKNIHIYEQAIDDFLATGVVVKQITQSTNGAGYVCTFIWYEDKPEAEKPAGAKTKMSEEKMAELLATNIEVVNWGPKMYSRIVNRLKGQGIVTLGQLVEKSAGELMKLGYYISLGRKSIALIRSKLAELGLHLKGE